MVSDVNIGTELKEVFIKDKVESEMMWVCARRDNARTTPRSGVSGYYAYRVSSATCSRSEMSLGNPYVGVSVMD
ncbi:hypothetical protein J1N35_033934 [Gossypium stocksii]|uniref:Uncharacterized protein n=1 Tax=Gossypium stocksii TaxID=47602 RepID=A0A9D3ZPL0_9ROSI|nr:hypothetical protein J1N35_033934 [Gossypium stocksii]